MAAFDAPEQRLRRFVIRPMRRTLVPALLGAALLIAAVFFTLVPGVDLDAAFLFYTGKNTFVGQTPLGEAVRRAIYWVPTLIVVGYLCLYIVRRVRPRSRFWAPSGREFAVILLSFALGPGLLVNTVLKNHSHRPRPTQTLNFGGDDAFRPFYTFDGACDRNCSFVSGEGAAAFWTLAPALMTPPVIQPVAVAAALAFGIGTGVLRMAFGGHYLSDTVFAALLTWTVTWIIWRIILGTRPSRADHLPERDDRA